MSNKRKKEKQIINKYKLVLDNFCLKREMEINRTPNPVQNCDTKDVTSL
jgi:hypothetical protein